MVTKQFIVTEKVGLHARPATLLVQEASQFSSDIEIEWKENKTNAKSILGVMSLGISFGDTFTIHANGEDETEAMEQINQLFLKEGIAK